VSVIIRSTLFNVAFYLVLLGYLICAIPTFFLPRKVLIEVAKAWGRTNLWLLRAICDISVDFRGLEKIPPGSLLIAAKHQSAWETFALFTLFDDPAFVLKRELQWLPFFGWYTIKARMIPVNRGARGQALAAMTEASRREFAHGRQLLIFPEGTRRPVGAEPRYKFGVSHLYAECGVPCVPIALNSGLFWPRRTFHRLPGTVRVEILDPIMPGLGKEDFLRQVQDAIETATARLVEEGRRDLARAGLEPITPRSAADRAA
jgi:1-acyl-sn-glycerol-3-phosphate acyltransferase